MTLGWFESALGWGNADGTGIRWVVDGMGDLMQMGRVGMASGWVWNPTGWGWSEVNFGGMKWDVDQISWIGMGWHVKRGDGMGWGVTPSENSMTSATRA